MYKNILNDYLPWDGGHLGSYNNAIIKQWTKEGLTYYAIMLPKGWCSALTDKQMHLQEGIVYCTAVYTKNTFPCIVEELKSLFGLVKRGVHRITIDNKSYIIYYVPITVNGDLIWETPLSRLDLRHPIRSDSIFKFEVQKIIVFCDLLSLTNTNESHIIIRPGSNQTFVPINSNENATTLLRAPNNDFSIITKVLYTRWFGEETAIETIVKSMIRYTTEDNLVVRGAELREKITNIITKYDNTLIWYAHFIYSRVTRYLLT